MTMTTLQSQTKPLDYDWLERELSKTKARLFTMKGAGFLGSLLCNHKFAWDEDAPTAWCNGETIAFNPYFFRDRLTKDTRITVLAHELWHTGCDHMGRLYDRDMQLWNEAGDYFINLMLSDQGYSFKGLNPLLDPAYANMSTETIYDILAVERDKRHQDFPTDGNGEPSEQAENAPDMSQDVRPLPKGVDKASQIGKIVQASQSSRMAKEVGILPGEVEQHIKDFLDPVLPWDALLFQFFTELSNDDYSWRRPSRRYEDEYLPTLSGENGLEHLTYYWDVSGSITDDEIVRINSEIKYVHDMFKPKRMTVVTFDTKLHDIFEFTDDDTFEDLTIHGRGGTSLACVYEHIKETKPTAAVILSDLYCHPMAQNPNVPVLWIVLDNPHAKTHFGKTIHLPRHKI